jgi:MSHA biogenesis protein MshM
MYYSHFGLREEPFGVTPDPRFFYQTPQHGEAVATAFLAIQQRRGFAMLVGPPGLGKTSVLFTLVKMLKGTAQTAYLPNPYYTRTTVLDAILASFGLEPAASPAANHRLLYQHLLKVRQAGKTCVVILDEAQDLDRDTLEAVRLLSNFETPEGKLVQIVLAGQPRLAETLGRPDCEQIRQRINAVSCLETLNGSEVRQYMAHRLETAGGSIEIFSRAAVEATAAASGGVPRNINTIAFNALSLAYALGRRQVAADDVAEACRDLAFPFADRPKQTAPAAPPSTGWTSRPQPIFAQLNRSFVPVWITGGLTLLSAGILLFVRF